MPLKDALTNGDRKDLKERGWDITNRGDMMHLIRKDIPYIKDMYPNFHKLVVKVNEYIKKNGLEGI